MKSLIVSIPIAGAIHISVEATDPEQAEKMAWDLVNEKGEDAGEVEWEFMEAINEGNVCHAPLTKIDVDEVD